MAIQSSIYATDGTTRTYPSTKHIATKQHCSVWKLRVSDSVWEISNVSEYSLVNNSVIFADAVLTSLYSEVEIRVADTADELLDSPTDIAIVASSIADINTVATDIADITNVADNIGAVSTVSGSVANVNTVASSIINVNNVGGSIVNVNAVALNAANINVVASDLLEPVSEIDTVATSIANVNTVGSAIANVNTVATNITNVNSVATTIVPNIAEILLADDNAIIATEQAVIATSMATVCTNIYDQFDDKYLGAKATPPLLDNDGNALTYGALYFDTTQNYMKVWSNAGWINAGSSVNGTTERYTYHATAGQTVFTATYEAGYIDVFLNGSKLENGVDFTAVTATNITLTSPAALNDVIDIICYAVFELSTAPTKDVVAYTVSTVDDLVSIPSSYTTAIVKDLDSGGTFIWSSTGTANGGTVFAGAAGYWTRQYSGASNVKWFGAKGDGITDDTVALTLLANSIASNSTIDFGSDTYLISYQGTAHSSVFGNVVIDILNKKDISFIGNKAVIKVVNHNIATYGGLRAFNFKGCKNIFIDGITFDMTFTGVNSSALYYPFCGAITAIDEDSATPSFSTLNSDFKITNCKFKLFHPYGNWATTSNPYAGDSNNGYKLFSIFVSGANTPSDEVNQNRNIEVSSCTWMDGHNGYGCWVWAWNNTLFINNIAESWVTKYSDNTGNYLGGGVAMLRYIPFWTHGLIATNNQCIAKKQALRVNGFEGISEFVLCANNQINVDNTKGETVISDNIIILGGGYSSSMDIGIFFNIYGSLSITDNTFDGHDGATSFLNQGISILGDTGDTLNGSTSISITGNTFGSWLKGQCIYLTNGSSISAAARRCKNLIITNNVSTSNDFFLRMSSYSFKTYEGVANSLISNNIIDGTIYGTYAPPSVNNYGIALAGNVSGDIIICTNNTIIGKTFAVLTYNYMCSSSASINISGNKLKTITTPYYTTSQIVSGQSGFFAGSKVYAYGDDSVTDAQPTIGAKHLTSGAEVSLFQQSTISYLMATNSLYIYTDSAAQVIVDSNEFKPSADNTKSLGTAALRWSVVYSGTGTINTSDITEKTFYEIEEAEVSCAKELKSMMRKFRFNDAIDEKGEDNARIHFGVGAQYVRDVFSKYGLDPFKYALLCYDSWDEVLEEKDEEGNIITEYIPAGDRYGIRYDELLCFIISGI